MSSVDPARGAALCLALSECFHESFKIEEDRPHQWRLVYALLSQHDAQLTRKTINLLLGTNRAQYDLVKKMLWYLHDEVELIVLQKKNQTPFSKEEADELNFPLTATIDLTPKLFVAARSYVRLLTERLGIVLTEEQFFDTETLLYIMRLAYDFQIGPIYGEWVYFIGRLYQFAQQRGLREAEFMSAVSNSNEHWLTLNFMWWFFVNVGEDPLSGDDARREMISRYKVHAVSTDMDAGMEFLVESKILEDVGDGKYLISKDCFGEFESYSERISLRSDELTQLIRNALGITTRISDAAMGAKHSAV